MSGWFGETIRAVKNWWNEPSARPLPIQQMVGDRTTRPVYRWKRKPPRLVYDGHYLQWWPPDGVGPPEMFKATSGGIPGLGEDSHGVNKMARVYQRPTMQVVPDAGPIPEGDYKLSFRGGPSRAPLKAGELVPSNGWQRIPKSALSESWGSQRIRLQPLPGTNTHGRTGFYAHDSHKGYSSGCVEIEPEFFNSLRRYWDGSRSWSRAPTLRRYWDGGTYGLKPYELPLTVKYQYNDTYGGTLVKQPKSASGDISTWL